MDNERKFWKWIRSRGPTVVEIETVGGLGGTEEMSQMKKEQKELKVAMDDRWVEKKKKCFNENEDAVQRHGPREMGRRKRERQVDCVCVCVRKPQTVSPLQQSGCSTVLRPLDIIQPFRHVKFPNMAL